MHKGAHSKRLHWSFGRGFSGQLDCSLLTGFEHLRTELEVLALLLTGRHHRDDQEAVNCQVPISGRHMEKFLAKSARLCLKRAKARMRRTVQLSDCAVPFRLVTHSAASSCSEFGWQAAKPRAAARNQEFAVGWQAAKPRTTQHH